MKTEKIEHCIKVYVQGGSSKIYDVRCVEANKACAELTALKEENERLREALEETRDWIKNWDPPFTEDEEWPATEAKITAALDQEGQ